MNRFELIVDQCQTDERRQIARRVDELLEAAHQTSDLIGRRRDERGIFESLRRADMNLQCSIFAGSRITSANVSKKDSVKFSNDACPDRNRLDPIESRFEGIDIVAHLACV